MFGNGFYEAELGRLDLQRRHELERNRRQLSFSRGKASRLSRLSVWLGGRLIAMGEALCARSDPGMLPTWRRTNGPDVIRTQAG